MYDLECLSDSSSLSPPAVEVTTVPFPTSYSNHSSASSFLSLLRLIVVQATKCSRRRSHCRCVILVAVAAAHFKLLSSDSRDDEDGGGRLPAAAAGGVMRTCLAEE